MKKMKLSIFSLGLLSALAVAGNSDFIQERAEASFTFDVSGGTTINVSGNETLIEVETWNKNQVEVYAFLEFKGKESDRVRDFIDNFESYVGDNIYESGSQLYVDADLEEPNRVQVGGKRVGVIIIGFSDEDLSITYRLRVPAGNDLNIENKYDDIILTGNYGGEVKVEHYSGDLEGGNFSELNLDLKYGTASLGRVSMSEMILYEQDLDIDNLGEGNIQSKYSKITLDEIGDVDLDSYESKIRIGSAETVEGSLKYGRLQIDNRVDNLDLRSIYELEVSVGESESIKLFESKYSEISVGNVGVVELRESYEDEFTIRTLRELRSKCKYTEYEIEELGRSFEIDGYESNVEIGRVSGNASLIGMAGKYCELDLNTYDAPFQLDVNIKYGDIDYPEEKVDKRIYVKENSQLEIQVAHRESSGDDLKIIIRGYEMDARIL